MLHTGDTQLVLFSLKPTAPRKGLKIHPPEQQESGRVECLRINLLFRCIQQVVWSLMLKNCGHTYAAFEHFTRVRRLLWVRGTC